MNLSLDELRIVRDALCDPSAEVVKIKDRIDREIAASVELLNDYLPPREFKQSKMSVETGVINPLAKTLVSKELWREHLEDTERHRIAGHDLTLPHPC